MPQAPSRTPLIAVVGNPNAGKTTLFNALTGSSQKVGNYPGVTVERVSSRLRLGEQEVEVVDIPGLYSLSAQSEDEKVAVAALLGEAGDPKPDLYLVVLNAANLERNLYLYSQLVETGVPLVAALAQTDVLRSQGREFDLAKLTHMLGTQVIPVVGHKGVGLTALRTALELALADPQPIRLELGMALDTAARVATLRERLSRSGIDASNAEIEAALLDERAPLSEQIAKVPELREALEELRASEVVPTETDFVASRYDWASVVTRATVQSLSTKPDFTARLDKVLTHRFFGLLIFAAIMYGVFYSIYTLAEPLMGWIEEGFGWLGDKVGGLLEGNPQVQSLVVDGLIGGVGAAVVFLPQILILFLFIAVLEGTGYLARASFLMDRLLGWCGLNGRAFIPLLSSFACAIPGIMAARVMPDQRSRLATILVAPLMSCSARMPVYVLLIGAFIEPQFGKGWAGFTLFAMHFLGLAVAIPIVFILNRGVLKGNRLPFLLELPPYQWPKWRDVWIAIWVRGKIFLKTAGTIIAVMTVVIWALLHYPQSEAADASYRAQYSAMASPTVSEENFVAEKQLENSYLGKAGRAIEPVFKPAGFDWRITIAILSAFPAREVVVSSLGVIFAVGEGDEESPEIREAIQQATWPDGKPLMTPWTAIGLMVFFALCAQCMATLAAVKRETNSWKWPVFMFVYMTGLAYLGALLVCELGKKLG